MAARNVGVGVVAATSMTRIGQRAGRCRCEHGFHQRRGGCRQGCVLGQRREAFFQKVFGEILAALLQRRQRRRKHQRMHVLRCQFINLWRDQSTHRMTENHIALRADLLDQTHAGGREVFDAEIIRQWRDAIARRIPGDDTIAGLHQGFDLRLPIILRAVTAVQQKRRSSRRCRQRDNRDMPVLGHDTSPWRCVDCDGSIQFPKRFRKHDGLFDRQQMAGARH